MVDAKVNQIRQLLLVLAAEDSGLAEHLADTMVDYITLTSDQIRQTQDSHFAKATCGSCLGTGKHQNGSNLLTLLERRQKPQHFTRCTPRGAPKGCRWVCWLCDGCHHIFTKSADLRAHLKSDNGHGFPDDQVKEVFSTRNGKALYEHFGPCTATEAAKNGWRVKSNLNSRKRKLNNAISSAFVAHGTENQGQEIRAPVVRADNNMAMTQVEQPPQPDTTAIPIMAARFPQQLSPDQPNLWLTPAEPYNTQHQQIQQPTDMDAVDLWVVGMDDAYESNVSQSRYPSDVLGSTIDNEQLPALYILESGQIPDSNSGRGFQTTTFRPRLAPNSWDPSLGVRQVDLGFAQTLSRFPPSDILTWADSSIMEDSQYTLDDSFNDTDMV